MEVTESPFGLQQMYQIPPALRPFGAEQGRVVQFGQAPQAVPVQQAPAPQPIPADISGYVQMAPPAPLDPYGNNVFLNQAAQGLLGTPGNQSVLSTPERQEALGLAWDKYLNDIRRGGESGGDKGERIANDIFGKLVAPAMAAFGGRGMSAAGVQLMQQAQQDVVRSQQERRMNYQHSLDGLKGLANIVTQTSPYSMKNLAALGKLANQHEGNQIRGTDAETRRMQAITNAWDKESLRVHRENQDRVNQQKANDIRDYRSNRVELEKMGIQFDYDKLNTVAKIQQMREAIKVRMQDKMLEVRRGENLKRNLLELQKLNSQERRFLQAETREVLQFNQKMLQSGARVDKNGKFVFQGADGKQLALPQLTPPDESIMTDLDGLESALGMANNAEGLTDAAESYLQQLEGMAIPQGPQGLQQIGTPQQAAPAQPATAAPSIQPAMMNAGIETLKQRLQMYPDRQEEILQGFHRVTGVDPRTLLNMTRKTAHGK